MFLSRLDKARNEKEEPRNISSSSKIGKESSAERNESKLDFEKGKDGKKSAIIQTPSKHSKILRELNEYLFDLFDANCMEDFHKMERFEQEAVKMFDSEDFISNPNYEFSHEQYAKHQEFLSLFESLVESFLGSFQYTPEMLYSEIERYGDAQRLKTEKQKLDEGKEGERKTNTEGKRSPSQWSYDSDGNESKESNDEGNALEIVEVISYYTSFEKWCEMMRENVKLKRHFRTFQEKLLSAAEDMKPE
jgi:hypothetical protein